MEFDIEMPTICQHCGVIFELNYGTTSNIWYPRTIICESCGEIEEREEELQEQINDLQFEIEEANKTIEEANKELEICQKKIAQILIKKDNAFGSRK